MDETRRDFLRKGLLGLTGTAVIPDINTHNIFGEIKQERKIVCRTLGKTGLKLPIVSMGTYDNIDIMPKAIESGIKHFQTSSVYRNGKNEKETGKILKTRRRDSYVLATGFSLSKFINPWTSRIKKGTKKEFLINSFERSLKRFGVDYVDIYYLCDINNKYTLFYEPFIEVVENLKRSGKIKYIGAATHQNEPEVIRLTADSNVYDVVMTAYNFRKINKEKIKEAIKYAARKGLGIVAMKTQAGVYWDKNRKNKINMKAALKWVLQDENVHTSVPAFSSINELEQDISVMENPVLTSSELEDLKIIDTKSGMGIMCQQCGHCIKQCKDNLNIPAIMRSYMYAYGYNNLYMAKQTLKSIDIKKIPCWGCDTCSVQCTMDFDIKKKILDVIRVNHIPDEFLV